VDWLRLWSLRSGTVDKTLLARTRVAVDDMEGQAPMSSDLNTLSDARMRRLTHELPLPDAKAAGEITYLDVYSASKFDLPVKNIDGERSGFKYAILFVDAYSRFRRVYFAKSQRELPGLARHYLSELGASAHAGGLFMLGDGFRRYVHTDGGTPMNSKAFEKVLLEFGLAANVTSCLHTPASNGVAERSFGTLEPDVRAKLAMSSLSYRHWS